MRIISREFLGSTLLAGALVACFGTTTSTSEESEQFANGGSMEWCADDGAQCPGAGQCCRALVKQFGEKIPAEVCNGEYVLCVGDTCTINDDGVTASCLCQIYDGVSQAFSVEVNNNRTVPGPLFPSYYSHANGSPDELCTVASDETAQWASCGGAICSRVPGKPGAANCQCKLMTAGPNMQYCAPSCSPSPAGLLWNGSNRKNPKTGKVECPTMPQDTEGTCPLQPPVTDRAM